MAFSTIFSSCPSAIKGERLARGESFWSGRMNELVIADHLSLADDGLLEGGMSSGSRDDEGVLVKPNQSFLLADLLVNYGLLGMQQN